MFTNDWHHHLVTVYIEDTDQYGVVYHANYIKYLERGRTEWLKEQGFKLSKAIHSGLFLVVTHMNIDFKNKAGLDSLLTIRTRMHKMRHAIAHFNQEIIDTESERLVAKATVHIACIDKNNQLCSLKALLRG